MNLIFLISDPCLSVYFAFRPLTLTMTLCMGSGDKFRFISNILLPIVTLTLYVGVKPLNATHLITLVYSVKFD